MNTEIVPALKIDETALARTLGDVEVLTAQLAPLRQRARDIQVDSPQSYADLGGVLSDVRAIRKQGKALFVPFDTLVDRVRTYLRTKLLVNQNACEEIEGIILPKMKEFERYEIGEAEKEEKHLNKAREKAGEAPVEVKPNLGKVAGYARRTNYKAEFVDFDALLKEFRKSTDKNRLLFLRQFIQPNAQRLGEFARDTKDSAQVQKLVPGTRAFED
jgi:hypothetical protein